MSEQKSNNSNENDEKEQKTPAQEFPRIKWFVDSNPTCADCDCSDPKNLTWADTTHGILICIRCCGVHRSLGTHISTCRSIEIDKWTDELVNKLKKNSDVNSDYEYHVPKEYPKPRWDSDRKTRERYIKAKYGVNTKKNQPLFHKKYNIDNGPKLPVYDPNGTKDKKKYVKQDDIGKRGSIQTNGLLIIKVIKAEDVPEADPGVTVNNKCDPYVKGRFLYIYTYVYIFLL